MSPVSSVCSARSESFSIFAALREILRRRDEESHAELAEFAEKNQRNRVFNCDFAVMREIYVEGEEPHAKLAKHAEKNPKK